MLLPWLDAPNLSSELEALRRYMDRVLEADERFEGLDGDGGLRFQRKEDHWLLELDVPGLQNKDLELTTRGGQLTVSGERKLQEPEGGRLRHRERRAWRFTRTVRLPADVDAENVDAKLVDGVLTLRLPTRPEAQPRRIEINR
jgi:HSP20 family protein